MTPEGEDKIRKAFANDDLNDVKAQNSWHIFKIMSEFVEGFEKMTRIGPCVSIFGSARTKSENKYYQIAEDIAFKLVQHGYGIITGGGPGIMEAANKGARKGNGKSVGLNIDLPFEQPMSGLPAKLGQHADNDFSERDILYKVLFDMKKDLTDLKKVVLDLLQNSGTANEFIADNTNIINKLVQEINPTNLEYTGFQMPMQVSPTSQSNSSFQPNNFHTNPYKLDAPIEEVEETLSLEDKEIDYIKKALKKHKGKRKLAAQELGISERTLYRKIKEYDINL